MFDSIKRMLGSSTPELSEQEAFKQLNSVAPLKSVQQDQTAPEHHKSSFVCREAVLDRRERIAGYKFALGHDLQVRMLEKSALIRRVYDDSMLRNLAPLRVSSLLGDRLSFIRLSVASLKNPLLKTLANSRTVIMITPGTIENNDLAEIHASLNHLAMMGVKHGWSINRPRPELAEFLPAADFIEIETADLDGLSIKKMAQDFRASNTNKKQQLIASELQTLDDFNVSFHCNFHYFMGPFVSSRENWHPPKSDINRLKVFEALNMIRSGAEFDAIADCLRNDPILTYKLLRYINSPGIGLQQQIDEIQQALLILGRDRFYRWLSLLLFDFNKPGFREHILKDQVLARARFMELIAGQGSIPASPDKLFMTGLFSLIDVMLGLEIDAVLKQVALPEEVAVALKGLDGPMRNALKLGIAVEAVDEAEMANMAAKCGLDATVVANTMIEAMSWAQQVVSAGE